MVGNKKHQLWAWCRGLVTKVPHPERTGIPYDGHRFPSSSLLVAWESNGGRSKALGPRTRVGDQEEAPAFRSAQLRPLQSLGE